MSLTKLFFAALAGFFVCLPASAQQTRVGTVVGLQTGDTACQVQWRDDSGKQFYDPADFDICTQRSLIGKRATFTYKTAKVMAASCQGDVNCKKSDTVVLIASARLTPLEAAKPTAPSQNAATATHCVGGETVMFHCVTGEKAVSVCAAGGAQGYMQYRFGKLGTAPESIIPEARTPPARAVSGENIPFAGGGGQWLRFKLGSYGFVTYSGIGRWGPNGAPKSIAGLVIEQNGKRTTNVKCVGKHTGQLQPDTFEQLGIKPNKPDFEFPTED